MYHKLQEDFKQKILDGYYVTHPQGDVLLELDMEAVITETIIQIETDQTESENQDD